MTTSASRHGEHRSVQMRLVVMQYGIVVLFATLAASFWFFQVLQHARFEQMAENNHQRALALRAPRGVLFDRDGRVLVENRYSFNVSIVREQATDLEQTIQRLATFAAVGEDSIREVLERHRTEPAYKPIVVIPDASLAQVAAVAARRLELPDVVVEEIPARHYLTDDLAAHLFGYVGEITGAQLARQDDEGLRAGAIVGQAGVEQAYNELLMGRDGVRHVAVNSLGREIETIRELAPAQGRRLMLTIDYDLQKAVEDGFRALGYWGAAVLLDPRSGEVLSLVSMPAYDPNAFAVGIDRATWRELNSDELRPLQNRALQGRYSPGSTFKIVVAAAALEEGIVTPDFKVNCRGGASFYGQYFRCHLRHGVVDMRQAIERSCNVYFYTLGSKVGVDSIHKWATALGFGVTSGIDLPHEVEGLVPSTEWKRRARDEEWYPGETISVSIGQGQVWVTPMSLAVATMTIANGGTRHTPHVLKATDEGAGWQPVPVPPPQSVVDLQPETVSTLHDGLWMVVNAAGTGGRARIRGRDVAGKTGTAQVISIQGRQAAGETDVDLRDHGWFVFFAPKDDPQVAGVVFAEHAEHGHLAAPIARHALATYFAKQEGRPLPEFPVPPPPAVGPPAGAPTAAEVVDSGSLPGAGASQE